MCYGLPAYPACFLEYLDFHRPSHCICWIGRNLMCNPLTKKLLLTLSFTAVWEAQTKKKDRKDTRHRSRGWGSCHWVCCHSSACCWEEAQGPPEKIWRGTWEQLSWAWPNTAPGRWSVSNHPQQEPSERLICWIWMTQMHELSRNLKLSISMSERPKLKPLQQIPRDIWTAPEPQASSLSATLIPFLQSLYGNKLSLALQAFPLRRLYNISLLRFDWWTKDLGFTMMILGYSNLSTDWQSFPWKLQVWHW